MVPGKPPTMEDLPLAATPPRETATPKLTRAQRRAKERQEKKLIQKRDALRLRAQKALDRKDKEELKTVHKDIENFKHKYYKNHETTPGS